MELITHEHTCADCRTKFVDKSKSIEIKLITGQEIEIKANNQELLRVKVPDKKVWVGRITMHVEEFDA